MFCEGKYTYISYFIAVRRASGNIFIILQWLRVNLNMCVCVCVFSDRSRRWAFSRRDDDRSEGHVPLFQTSFRTGLVKERGAEGGRGRKLKAVAKSLNEVRPGGRQRWGPKDHAEGSHVYYRDLIWWSGTWRQRRRVHPLPTLEPNCENCWISSMKN